MEQWRDVDPIEGVLNTSGSRNIWSNISTLPVGPRVRRQHLGESHRVQECFTQNCVRPTLSFLLIWLIKNSTDAKTEVLHCAARLREMDPKPNALGRGGGSTQKEVFWLAH